MGKKQKTGFGRNSWVYFVNEIELLENFRSWT